MGFQHLCQYLCLLPLALKSLYTSGWSACARLPAGESTQCLALKSLNYTFSATGMRLLHADVCTGIETLILDTDGQVGQDQWQVGEVGEKGDAGGIVVKGKTMPLGLI